MDFYQFVNSRDIREHLKTIRYQFTATEAAWLVWQSKHTTYTDRHNAWHEIIRTFPDCEIEKRRNTEYQPGLHSFLKKLMEFENRCISAIKTEEPYTFFCAKYLLSPEDEWDGGYNSPEADFDTCFEMALDACKAYSNNHDIGDARIRIRKQWFDGAANAIEVEFTASGDVLNIINYGACTEEELNLVEFGFDGMWFDFPTPFKRGDILIDVNNRRNDAPFVLSELCTESEYRERWLKNGDMTDMVVWGYFQNEENGNIFDECDHTYMNMEFYRGKLCGVKRVLKALSSYLKGEISIALYSSAYGVILAEEHAKSIHPLGITEEGLRLAGLL